MLSYTNGEMIARIDGTGYNSGQIIYIYDPNFKCCERCNDSCKNPRNKHKCCDRCMANSDNKISKYSDILEDIFDDFSIDKKIKSSDIKIIEQELTKLYNQTNDKFLIKLQDSKEYVVPLPCTIDDNADHIYIAGQTGSGKSTWIANYVKELKKLYPKMDIFLFSTFDEDKALDLLKPTRITINEEIVDSPISKEELKNSVVIFDDIDTIQPKKLANAIRRLRDDLLQNGRKLNIRVISTSHQVMNYRLTRDLIAFTQKVVLFPQCTTYNQLSRFLTVYIGLDKKEIKFIKDLNTRWIMIYKNHPSYMLWSSGAVILNKISEIVGSPKKQK